MPRMQETDKDIVRRMHEGGSSLREIGEVLDFSHTAIAKFLKREGLTKPKVSVNFRFDTIQMVDRVKSKMLAMGVNKNSIRGVDKVLLALQAIVDERP